MHQARFPTFILLTILLPFGLAAADAPNADQERPPACVILLHGLGRRAASMTPMADDLEARGFRVFNIGYPSTEAPVEFLTDTYLLPAVENCRQAGCQAIHMVAHSLGGIMVRQFLQAQQPPEGSRIVMLSPPNQGSEVVDVLGPYFFYRWFMGPAGQQLGTAPDSLPNRLRSVDVPIGVITGSYSWNLILSVMIPGPDDGKVSIESAKLDGMADFIVLPVTHTFIMQDEEVMVQTAYFLKNGRFDHSRLKQNLDDKAGPARTANSKFEK